MLNVYHCKVLVIYLLATQYNLGYLFFHSNECSRSKSVIGEKQNKKKFKQFPRPKNIIFISFFHLFIFFWESFIPPSKSYIQSSSFAHRPSLNTIICLARNRLKTGFYIISLSAQKHWANTIACQASLGC